MIKKVRIMVIDDDQDILNLINNFFSTRGFEVDLYTEAQQALTDIAEKKSNCDVIITDLLLPGISGIEF
ncbi:MAG: response regulator, partial [Bdellovibrionota bacterium]